MNEQAVQTQMGISVLRVCIVAIQLTPLDIFLNRESGEIQYLPRCPAV